MTVQLRTQVARFISVTVVPLLIIPVACGLGWGGVVGHALSVGSASGWMMGVVLFAGLSFTFHKSPLLFIGTYTSSVIFKLFLLAVLFLSFTPHFSPYAAVFVTALFMNLFVALLFTVRYLYVSQGCRV